MIILEHKVKSVRVKELFWYHNKEKKSMVMGYMQMYNKYIWLKHMPIYKIKTCIKLWIQFIPEILVDVV